MKEQMHKQKSSSFNDICLSSTKFVWKLAGTMLVSFCWVSMAASPSWGQSQRVDIELQIGVVQRFGSKANDNLTVKATEGEKLALRYQTIDGEAIVHTESIKLQVAMYPLPEPILQERVVLSSHRSFESAEQSALLWRARGIETEIAHPDRWQVWAKRSVYHTPLLRRLLLKSLKAHGDDTSYMETKVLRQFPQAFWILDGYRYNRHQLDIISGKDLIQVSKELDGQSIKHLYGGSLRLQLNAYGSYTLVNKVPLETYLRGVVPHEIGAEAPEAALEAQAILARTYVLRNLRRFAIDDYQLCATPECQVYKGLAQTYGAVDKAIAATKGLVLTYNNQLVDALYSSTTGGITAPYSDLWDGPERPYLTAVVDSVRNVWDLDNKSLASESNFRSFINLKKGFNEEDWDWFRWRYETSLSDMTKFLNKYLKRRKHPQAGFQKIHWVQVVERSPAGRVLKMEVQTDKGRIEIEKDQIRDAFWAPISTLFYIEPLYRDDRTLRGYAFVGGGFGHGVGLSQAGSHRLGQMGWSSERILSFYFPGTHIQQIHEEIIFWQHPPSTNASAGLSNLYQGNVVSGY